jgi:positive regulator of sigma E activity
MNNENPNTDSDKIVGIEDNLAIIEMEEKEACHSCAARFLCQPNDTGMRIIKVKNSINAKVGDKVLLERSDTNQLKLTGMQYGLPLVGFLVAILISNKLINHTILSIPAELFQFAIGIITLLLVGILTNLWCRKKAAEKFSIFKIHSIE